jgi:hypothetical protein
VFEVCAELGQGSPRLDLVVTLEALEQILDGHPLLARPHERFECEPVGPDLVASLLEQALRLFRIS